MFRFGIVVTGIMLVFFNHAYGQNPCIRELRDMQASYNAEVHGSEADYIFAIGDSLRASEKHKPCFTDAPFLIELGEHFAQVKSYSGLSREQYEKASNSALSLFKESGKMQPDLVGSNGRIAKRICEEYWLLTDFYLKILDTNKFEDCKDSLDVWSTIYIGNSEMTEEHHVSNKVDPIILPTTNAQTLPNPKKKITIKPLVVLTDESNLFAALIESNVRVQVNPPCSVVVKPNETRACFELHLEEGVKYRVEISYPGYESQYAITYSDEVRFGDSIRVIMIPEGTPYVYLYDRKVDAQFDEKSILIIPKGLKSRSILDSLILANNLIEVEGQPFIYRKTSNEKFDPWNDEVLLSLRNHPEAVAAAGHGVLIGSKTRVLTNQIQIVWRKKPEDWTPEEKSAFDSLASEYSLSFTQFGIIEAKKSAGSAMNEIVGALNNLKVVFYAYPLIYGVNTPN